MKRCMMLILAVMIAGWLSIDEGLGREQGDGGGGGGGRGGGGRWNAPGGGGGAASEAGRAGRRVFRRRTRDLPHAPAAAREAEWRTAAAPASTAGRRSVLLAERAPRRGREAAPWREADRRSNREHGHPLVAAREVPGPDLAPASDLPSVAVERDQELAPDSCRRWVLVEARDPELAQANDRGSLTGLVLVSVLALAPALVPA